MGASGGARLNRFGKKSALSVKNAGLTGAPADTDKCGVRAGTTRILNLCKGDNDA